MEVLEWGQCGVFTLNVPTISQCRRVPQSLAYTINPLAWPLDWENAE